MEDSDLDDILNDILQDDEPVKKKTPTRSSTTQPQAPTAPGFKPEPSLGPLAPGSKPEPSPGPLAPGSKPEPAPVVKGNPAVPSEPKYENAESDKQNKKKLMQELFLDKKEKEEFPKTEKVNLQEPRKPEPTKTRPKPEAKEVLKEKKPENIKMDFDDDILGKIEKPRVGASKAGFLDDIFGKKSEKESKPNFLDDIMSGETGKRRSSKPENEFVLDSKYKKNEDNSEPNPQPRRRRGNPEVQTKETLFKEDKAKESISAVEDTPFPWMAKKSETKPPQEPPQQQQQHNLPQQQQNLPQQPPGATQQPQQSQVSTYQQPAVGQQPPMPTYQQQAPYNPVPNPYFQQPVLPQYQPQLLPTQQYQPLPLPDTAGLERQQAEAFNREMENLNQVKIIKFL